MAVVVDRARRTRQGRQETAAREQKHKDHLPPEEFAVSQRDGEVLAPGKEYYARLRMLQDVSGGASGSLPVLQDDEVQTGSAQVCKKPTLYCKNL